MLKAVIFDLDGLLVDSTPLQQRANEEFITSFGKIYMISEGREGLRIIDILREFKDIYNLPGNLEDLYTKRQMIFYRLAREKLELFPGARAVLEKFKARSYTCALATSGDRGYIAVIFEKYPLFKHYFQVILTSEDVVRGKPDPEIYTKTVTRLGVTPQEAVVIEDSINGILAAKRAGIQVICIPNYAYPNADYSLADQVFYSLEELSEALV